MKITILANTKNAINSINSIISDIKKTFSIAKEMELTAAVFAASNSQKMPWKSALDISDERAKLKRLTGSDYLFNKLLIEVRSRPCSFCTLLTYAIVRLQAGETVDRILTDLESE